MTIATHLARTGPSSIDLDSDCFWLEPHADVDLPTTDTDAQNTREKDDTK